MNQKVETSIRGGENASGKGSGKTAAQRRIAGTFDAYMMSKCPID